MDQRALSEARRAAGGGGYFLHESAFVAESSVVFPGVYIGPDVTIGEGCVIGPNTCIGQPGFGYTKHDDRTHTYRPHTMGVLIEDDVHIGACTTIDQGRHRPTLIKSGARIDNLVHIAHNVEVGHHALVIAHSMLAGSVIIGDYAHVAPGAMVRDWRTVGEEATVGLGAVVVHNVQPGEIVMGNPARQAGRS